VVEVRAEFAQLVGTTRSSKAICQPFPDSPRADIYQKMSEFHREAITKEEMRRQKKSLGIVTIFDVIKFGNSRSHAVLVNERPLRIKEEVQLQ